jgi:hypothetical protein
MKCGSLMPDYRDETPEQIRAKAEAYAHCAEIARRVADDYDREARAATTRYSRRLWEEKRAACGVLWLNYVNQARAYGHRFSSEEPDPA